MSITALQRQWEEFGRRDFFRSQYLPPTSVSKISPQRKSYDRGWLGARFSGLERGDWAAHFPPSE